MRSYLLLLFTIIFLLGCQKETCQMTDEVAQIPVDLQLERLEEQFFKITTDAEMKAFLQQHPKFANSFLQQAQYPSQEVLLQNLLQLATDTSIKKLVREAETTFGDFSEQKESLENAFKHVKYYYPDFYVPKVQTYISGLSRDLYVSDSLVVLGLDFFIGKSASYRPQAPQYILNRYEKELMVPATLLLVSNKFNKTDLVNNVMLEEMIDYGKSYYFVERMMPCTPDSLIIGYSSQEMTDVRFNEAKIWAHFLEKGLIYEQSQFIIRKYIGERPNVPEIGAKCPGRIGTWVGWQLVRKYMEAHPDVTLPQLMAEKNARKILEGAKYKPQKK